MPTERTCAECGAPLPANAPGNRCPKCLLQIGLEETAADRSSAEPQQPAEKTVVLAQPGVFTEQIGTVIGRYKLLQQIGEGGFGIVFMAEQTEPVQRKVALKIIKAGMDTREIIARFEAERQALALMDHPNIAQVLDGGTTATGRPYFVMELVRGMPITDYCDQAGLSTRERLELFIKVCRAVQHAHQKGVIHRDIKPSNVLVTLHDGEPVPKVIDFGVAKALGQKLTEKTLFTRFEQMIGTPAYMSPEQAALSGLDIDTRSDIYSLGVLLYQLLTGVTPLDAETLRQGAWDEIRRMIRETDPPKPSTRISDLVAADVRRLTNSESEKARASLRRLLQQKKDLVSAVRGDLDWITMKALEKDRQRRYETVNGLAADIERHLCDEPVLARPPSRLYRLQKVARRRRVAFAAVALIVLAATVSFLFGVQTHRAEQRRLAERRQNAIDKALLTAWTGDLDATEQSIRDAELAGVSVADLRMLRGYLATLRGDYRDAVQHLEQAWKLSPKSVAVCSMLIRAYSVIGQWDKAQPIYETLDRLVPKTPEDFLFKGSLEALMDPAKGLETLNQAVRRRPTGIACPYRGSVRASLAHDTAKIDDLEAAIADVNATKALWPTNAQTITLSLRVNLIATAIYEEKQLLEKRTAAWRQVEADASTLKQYPGNQAATLARGLYLKQITDDPIPFRELRASATNGLTDYFLAVALYQRGEFEAALDVLQTNTDLDHKADYMRGYFLAELPNGPELALKEFYRLWQGDPSTWDTLTIQTTLRLLGRKEEATEICRKGRERRSFSPPWRREWYRQLLDYNCGDLSEEDLMTAAGASRYNQSEAHFFVALTRLAEADRRGARGHFRASVDTRIFHCFYYDWSKAFLARMECDLNWPQWIPVKTQR